MLVVVCVRFDRCLPVACLLCGWSVLLGCWLFAARVLFVCLVLFMCCLCAVCWLVGC